MSLTGRTISGIKWSGTAQVIRSVTRIGAIVLLGRLLAPRDFGIMAMAVVVTGFVDLFRELGTGVALIQRKETSQRLLSSVFWANSAFGLLGTAAIFALAPLASDFYHAPRLVPVMQVLSASFVLSGVSVVQQALLSKRLAFKKLAIIQSSAAIAGAAAAVVLAAVGAGVYALVAQSLVTTGITTVALWARSDWHPGFAFAVEDLRSVWSFSANVVGFNVVNYLARNVDYLLIGRYLGAQKLGYYTLAYNLLLFPLQNLSYVMNSVLFPAFASIQDETARIASAYLRAVRVMALLAFPVMLGLLAVCDLFVPTVYGAKWTPAIPLVAILVPVGLTQSFSALNGSIYQATGRADLQFRVGSVSSTIVVASFFIGLHWGIIGVATAYAVTVVAILSYPLMVISLRLVGLGTRDLLSALRRPFAASLCMLAGVGAIRLVFTTLGTENGTALLVLVLAGALLYCAATYVFDRAQVRQVWMLLRPRAAGL